MSFDLLSELDRNTENSLNPFGTGQCLSTTTRRGDEPQQVVSIPLEQGNVFRQKVDLILKSIIMSQSLWNRAMSFDVAMNKLLAWGSLNPFGTGQYLSTFINILITF